MPLLLNSKPNPQAVVTGKQHHRKVMLGDRVVWQKHRPKSQVPGIGDLTLETIDHRGVKLVARNENGKLSLPMHFPPRPTDNEQWYLDKLTFLGDAALSLQTIDAMLEAEVIGKDIYFPMLFFDDKPPEEYDFRHKLTFISNTPMQLGMQSIDALLVADVQNERHLYFPMVFPGWKPTSREEFLNRLTFIDKETSESPDFTCDFLVNAYDHVKDYLQNFPVNVFDPFRDFIQDFDVNAYRPDTDYMQDFGLEILDSPHYIRDFIVNAYNPEKDYIQDFTANACDFAKDFIKDFSVNAFDAAKDFFTDFIAGAYNPSTDYIKDFSANAFSPTKDFVKDFSANALSTIDYTKTFNFTAILTGNYTKDFSASAVQGIPYTKDFSFSAKQYISFTKDFTATAVAQATGNVLIVWVSSSTFTVSPPSNSNVTHYLASRNMYVGSPPTLTFDGIMTPLRNYHGSSLTGTEISSSASSNNAISVPSGIRYVVYALQNVSHLIVTGNLTVSAPFPRIH